MKELFSYKYMDPFYRPYKCKDGRYYYVVSIAHDQHAKRVMEAAGVYETVLKKIKQSGLSQIDDVYLSRSKWGNQASFKTYPVSREWSKFISQELEKAFLKKTCFEWEEILAKQGAVGGAHRTFREWMHEKHARESGLFVKGLR